MRWRQRLRNCLHKHRGSKKMSDGRKVHTGVKMGTARPARTPEFNRVPIPQKASRESREAKVIDPSYALQGTHHRLGANA